MKWKTLKNYYFPLIMEEIEQVRSDYMELIQNIQQYQKEIDKKNFYSLRSDIEKRIIEIDEFSIIKRGVLNDSSNYFSVFMGTYDPIGSDIFLQRYFGITPIASKIADFPAPLGPCRTVTFSLR